MRALRRSPRPALPTLIGLGTRELVVDPEAIRHMASDWPSAELRIIDGAKHELLMEAPDKRAAFLDAVLEHFAAI